MEIFELYLWTIRRDKNSSYKPVRKNNSINNNYHAKPIPTGPEYLLVDGYNIIFAWDELNGNCQRQFGSCKKSAD